MTAGGRPPREGDVSIGPQPEDFSSKGNSMRAKTDTGTEFTVVDLEDSE